MKKKVTKEDLLNSDFIDQFKTGEDLEDFLSQVHKRGLEKILEAELEAHLGYEKHSKEGNNSGNSRNGITKKTVKTEYGETELEVPRDRNSSFDPQIIPKRKRTSSGIENLVTLLYAKGMSNSDIEEHLKEFYDLRVSTSSISIITSMVQQDILEWQNRPLDPVYLIVWMDGIVFKVRQSGKVINKTIYLAIGLTKEGMKEVLGLWVGESESASFWMGVMSDLQARGVKDILITSTDNLNGFTDAITSVFPQAVTQICVVHQIRNSSRYVVWKDKKQFAADLKLIYNAPNKDTAKLELDRFEEKWNSKYPYAIKSWKANWDNLTHFLEFPLEIRKIIYTTNIIENLNAKIRKYTKSKGSFPDDNAVKKSVFLSIREITKKWTQPIHNWGIILNQFITIFGDRCKM